MLKSELRPYSIGLVLEDKKPDSDIIVVQPTEALTNKSGDLTEYKHKHGDIIGDNRIECRWIDFSDIRETPPDVVTGEKVHVLRYEKSDMYYWYSGGRSNNLRRLEHIQWNLSNTEGRDEDPKSENQLFFIASTRNGYIEVVTPQNREEKALFRIKANFKDGKISFSDGAGGSFSWDTESGKIKLTAKEVYWKVPKVTINGKVFIMRGLDVIGQSKFLGSVKVVGQVTVAGFVKVLGVCFAFLFQHI